MARSANRKGQGIRRQHRTQAFERKIRERRPRSRGERRTHQARNADGYYIQERGGVEGTEVTKAAKAESKDQIRFKPRPCAEAFLYKRRPAELVLSKPIGRAWQSAILRLSSC